MPAAIRPLSGDVVTGVVDGGGGGGVGGGGGGDGGEGGGSDPGTVTKMLMSMSFVSFSRNHMSFPAASANT